MLQQNINLKQVASNGISTELVNCILDFCKKYNLSIYNVTGEIDEDEECRCPSCYKNNFHIKNNNNDTYIIISINFVECDSEVNLTYSDYDFDIEESYNKFKSFEKIISNYNMPF